MPVEPLVGPERKTTLLRLNQIIQHRLVTGQPLPQQMRSFKIANGRVQFRVEQEFEVGLTLMGDAADIPWRMLEIEILVEDNETGSEYALDIMVLKYTFHKPLHSSFEQTASNTALVNNMQLGFMHQLVQARMIDSSNPVQEMYNCLHYFCQSLQLEVLFGQTMHLKQHRLNESVQVEEYVRGSKLTVSYWRDLSSSSRSAFDQRSADCGYRLTVQTDPNDSARPLAVFHLPSIGNRESAEMADRAVRSDGLSMERLLVHTVYIRSLARLSDMRGEFQSFMKEAECELFVYMCAQCYPFTSHLTFVRIRQVTCVAPRLFSPCPFSCPATMPNICTFRWTRTPASCAVTYPSTRSVRWPPTCKLP